MMVRTAMAAVLAAALLHTSFQSPALAQTFQEKFGHVIDLNNLDNYANQPVPGYIQRDNGGANPITDLGATLGRILFYDKELSFNRTTSCSSCHAQALAFADSLTLSQGENGLTGRHSMRLINSRFAQEVRFFWDERAATLEEQSTQPIQDHIEMGFSGQNGNPDFSGLVARLSALPYYQELFTMVFGDDTITEARMQLAIAQFVRSIQSFDSPYDTGRAQVPNDGAPFPNFSQQENQGKQLFLAPPQFQGANRIGGGLGCAGCHRPPEFDIDPNSRNNGVIQVAAGSTATDLTNTRSPSLRDTMSPIGDLNTQMMHNGLFTTMDQVLDHYNSPPPNPQIDRRLVRPGGVRANFNITAGERAAVTAFLETLTGTDVYINPKWSDPFVEPPPGVESLVVHDGSNTRSMLTGITVVFNREVNSSVASFALTNTTTGTTVSSLIHSSQVIEGKSIVLLTFDPGDSVHSRPAGNTLMDGEYQLTVIANQVTAASGGEAMTADVTMEGVNDGLFRLYGDANGDANCDFTDFSQHFLPALFTSSSSPNFRPDLDFDGDNDIDMADYTSGILANFGKGFTSD